MLDKQKQIFGLLFILFITVYAQPTNPQPSGGNATQLLEMLNAYRVNNGKTQIPISRALMHVAQRHADAIFKDSSAITSECSTFSWPDNAPNGVYWKPCCYFRNHTNTNCMNNKTREITSSWTTPYSENYYEISGGLTGFYDYPENALFTLWTNNAGIRDTILNNGGWSSISWRALGLGIAGDFRRRYGFLAFGTATDTNIWQESDTTTSMSPLPVNNVPIPVPVPAPQSSNGNGNGVNPSGGNPEQLVVLVNNLRVENRLQRLNVSRALMYTAQYHANAVANNESAITGECSAFSWPAPSTGSNVSWTACCSLNNSDLATSCMTQKAREITSRWTLQFNGDAYEIATWIMNVAGASEQELFNVWRNNTNTTDFLLGKGNWLNSQWTSIGTGIARAGTRTYAYLWLSSVADSNEWRGFGGGSQTTNTTTTNTTTSSPQSNPAPSIPQIIIILPNSTSNSPSRSPSRAPSPLQPQPGVVSPGSYTNTTSSNGSFSGVLVSSGGNSERLVELVNSYREQNGLMRLVLSKALMYTGQYHASSVAINESAVTSQCTLFSWPSPPQGRDVTWRSCCSSNITSNFTCMVQKPREITARWVKPFNGDAYEIAAWIMNMNGTSEESIFSVWRDSTNSTDFMLGRGNWTNSQWKSIGAGIARAGSRTYAYLWLSTTVDTNEWQGFAAGEGATNTSSNSSSSSTAIINTNSTGMSNSSTYQNNTSTNQNNTSANLRPSGGNPERLLELVNNYLAENSRARLNTSRALMHTAQYHANAVANNESAVAGNCTALSWPAPPSGVTWTQCCYTNSTSSSCMSQKPREITARWTQSFNGEGYEIAAWIMNKEGSPEENIFNVWKNSTTSTSFILATGSWAGQQWKSIGVGISKTGNRTYAYLWLSTTVDPNTWQGYNPSGLSSVQVQEKSILSEEMVSGASHYGYMITNVLAIVLIVLLAF